MLISKFSNNSVEEELASLEQSLKIMLPEQYRKFLLKYNGGETPKTEFKIGRESSNVRAFFGLGDVAYCLTKKVKLADWKKKLLLPIAVDSFGNYIVIGVGEENYGKIYFCDHEKRYKATLLTEELKEFISRCKSKKIGKILSIEEREKMVLEAGWIKKVDDEMREIWQAEIDKYANIKQERVIID